MSEREKEREREKRKESKRERGGRERREMSVHYSCLFCTYQAYQMDLTTENHVWMFPAWYRPDWYKEDYKLPNNDTVLCTKAQVCT